MFVKFHKNKIKAQSIIEFCLTFILVAFLFFFIAEFAIYLQTLYSVQTFSDEINANLVLYKGSNVCSAYNDEVLDLINSKAQKYLEKKLDLSYEKNDSDIAKFTSKKKFLDKDILKVEILCNSSNESFMTRSTYLYRGLFIFKTGKPVSSLSSVQTPKF